MSYTRQVQKIVAGSMNILPPADVLAEPDSAIIQNFRTDQAGNLRSRGGMDTPSSVTCHSLFRNGNNRYGGTGSALNQGTSLGTVVTTGFDGTALGFAAYQEFTWVMNRSKQVRVDGSTAYNWGIAAPVAAPMVAVGGAGSLTGDFIYYITFMTATGAETNGGPASATVSPAAQSVNLTAIPVSSDAQVSRRRIYRQLVGGVDGIILVGTIFDNTTTTYNDNVVEADVSLNPIFMPSNHDQPPAARGLIPLPYFGKLIAYATATDLARMFWTPTALPYYFPGAGDDAEGNWIDVGDDQDEVLWISNHTRFLVIYKRRSIWRLVGDPDTNDPELIHTGIGMIGGQAGVNAGEFDYFASDEGWMRTNGDSIERVPGSDKLDPIFKGYFALISSGISITPIDLTNRGTSAMGHWEGKTYFSYPEAGQSAPNVTLIYDSRSGHIVQMRGIGGFQAFLYEGLYAGGVASALLGAVPGGAVYRVDAGENGASVDDVGNPIPLIWQTRELDQGAPGSQKIYGEIAIEFQSAISSQTPCVLTVKAIYDGAAAVTIGTFSSATRTIARFKLGTNAQGVKAQKVALRIEGSSLATVYIFKTWLFYYGEARNAISFDSGVIDLGTEKFKTADRIEVHMESGADLSYDIWTDASGTLATQRTGTVTSAAGRTVTIVTLSSPVDGRYFRLMFYSAANFQMHVLRIRVQPMGLFVDQFQPWQSEALLVA